MVSALRFEWPADALIRDLKYRGETAHARVLGVLLARAVRERGDRLPHLLLPVPLHDTRFRERGFNQAVAITRHAGRTLEIPYALRALRRVRHSPSQTGLNQAERAVNVRGAFALNPRARARLLLAAHVAVIDDVTTTGSTLGEVAAALLAAGVKRVDRWSVARAPRQEP